MGRTAGWLAWSAGIALGVGIAAVEVVPLGATWRKARSGATASASANPPGPWPGRGFLDSACTALPYLYGSQRRGQPNLAKAIGVHNLNESAGGFAGWPP